MPMKDQRLNQVAANVATTAKSANRYSIITEVLPPMLAR
jgi:hypothetical protein